MYRNVLHSCRVAHRFFAYSDAFSVHDPSTTLISSDGSVSRALATLSDMDLATCSHISKTTGAV